MGRIHSKQVCKRTAPEGECVLVDGNVTSVKDLVDAINSGSSFSKVFAELGGSKSIGSEKIGSCDGSPIEITGFMECCEKPDSADLSPDQPCALNIPLRVSLPPLSAESNLLKLLTFDQSKKIDNAKEGTGSIRTDTTDNNHGSEMSDILEREEKKTCAVATEKPSGGLENQEWLFTLYDFDDLGKITKEDIVGLFKSLYDAVDSVATLQHHGARILKLHLTVTPDDQPKCAPDVTPANRTEVQEQYSEGPGVNKVVSCSIPDGPRCCAGPKKLSRSRPPAASHFHDGSPHIPRHRPPETRPLTTCGGERRTNDTSTTKNDNFSLKKDVQNLDLRRVSMITRRQSFSEGFAGAISADPATDFASAAGDVRRRGSRQRRCSGASKRLLQFDEQTLAHLIQHSMDLNGHQHSSKVRHNFNSSAPKKWNQDSSMNQKPSCCADCPTEDSTHHRNHYLDLAGVENYEAPTKNNGLLRPSAQPNFGVFGDEEMTNSCRKSKWKPSPLTRKHSRCISDRKNNHRTSVICEEDKAILTGVVGPNKDANFAKPVKLELPAQLFETTGSDNVSLSHYRRRHRNRERNLSRAMRQVAEWIETEHGYRCRTTEERVVVVRKHEHHHVHEHFHHHIHHCGSSNT